MFDFEKNKKTKENSPTIWFPRKLRKNKWKIWEARTWQNCQRMGVGHVKDTNIAPTQTQTWQVHTQEEKSFFLI